MAKHTSQRLSSNPDNAEQGGGLGFPVGSVVTLTEVKAGTWEEAGEKALVKGRKAADAALILTGDVEEKEEPVIVFLSAGKANRIAASSDGEYFEAAEGSSAKGLTDNCNAMVFLASLSDKKRQGKMALPKEHTDENGFSGLVGLKFRAGQEIIERKGLEDEDGNPKKPSTSLVAEEILKLPKGAGGGGGGKDEEEDDSKLDKKFPKSGKGKKSDVDAQAETAVLAAFENPKYRKGIPLNKVFTAVFNNQDVRASDQKDEILELAKDEDWVKDTARPWESDDEAITPVS